MGVVYRARDLKLEREVALKRPRSDLLGDPEFHRRFMTEARTASKLMHPNITTVFEVFEEEGVPWLVMELIQGASLRSLLQDGSPLSFEDVLRHGEGLADALRVAHIGGVLHRDINPNNILVGGDGRARLSDFGLARAWEDPERDLEITDATTQARTHGAAGTRGYMSPEQVLGKPLDPRSDLFSLGVVLYEMSTGRPAFARGSGDHWVDAVLHRDPEPISRVNADMPPEFESVVRKALAKRPFQRYQSASELLLDLRALRRRLESDSAHSWSGVGRRPSRRRRWLGVGVLAAVAVAAVVGFMVLRPAADDALELVGSHKRLTTHPGWDGQPALSPDGTMIAYTSDDGGDPNVWIVHTAGGEPTQRTTHPGSDTDPAWFPDGSGFVFVSDRDGAPSVWRIPVLGGSPMKVVPDAEQPAVSPDGSRIAFARANSAGLTRISVAPLADLSQVEVLTGDDDGLWSHEFPAWSPDGSTLCYADHRDLWLVPADGGPARRLTADGAGDFDPAWTPDGRHVVFTSMRERTVALWSVPAAGGEPRRLTTGTSSEREPALSREASWLAYCTSESDANVVVLDRRTGDRSVIPGSKDERMPGLAPDGSLLVFMSDRSGRADLWLQPLDGLALAGPARQLTDHPGTVALPEVSPDGSWIAYQRALEGRRDIWLVPTAGGVPRRFTDHPGNDIQPAWSPDGTQLAWVSDRAGVENVWLAPVADGRRTGEPRRLTRGDAADLFPRWSPDGGRLAYVEERGYRAEAMIQDVVGGGAPVRVTEGAQARRVRWPGPGDELLVSGTWGSDRVRVRAVSLVDGGVRELEPAVVLGLDADSTGLFAVGKGGQILAYETTARKGDVWLAETNLTRR
jgi:Tol biopolymer transport system component/tRNA A-37 threonylcarbamoyl transferase component Bud32